MVNCIPFNKLIHHPNKHQLVLTNGNTFTVFNTSDGNIVKEFTSDIENKTPYSDIHCCVSFNADGTLFVSTGDDKEIRVYDTENEWKIVSSQFAAKRVNAVQFSKDGKQIIVADKFGDVYCHPITPSEEKLAPIVGHVSMLTDVVLSNDQKYVITADRDEHIRVSRFPNGYNIETFCLGHTDVITIIRLLPWDTNILISAGGDNTIRTWDFVKGKEIQSLNYLEHINKYIPEDIDKTKLPIVSNIKFSVNTNTIAVVIAKIPGVLLFKWNQEEKSLEYKEIIECNQTILDVEFDLENKLWVSLLPNTDADDLVTIFENIDEKFKQIDKENPILKSVNAIKVQSVELLPDLFPIFGLRKFYDISDDAGEQEENNKKQKQN
ncbi:unnamed protein product [Cunninghamella blakesleeana]